MKSTVDDMFTVYREQKRTTESMRALAELYDEGAQSHLRHEIEEMCEILTEQKSALDSLRGLAQEKQRIIIKGESEELEDIVRQEHRMLSKINGCEKKRMAIIPQVAKALGVQEKDITVSSMMKYAKGDERSNLSRLQKELTALMKRLKSLNEENQELIKAHLEYADSMMELMVDSEDPLNNFYGGDGKASDDKKKTTGFFDGQA